MIGNNHIRSSGDNFGKVNFFYVIKTKNAHAPAPHDKELKTCFFPLGIKNQNVHERVKEDGKNAENNSNIYFPGIRKYPTNVFHFQI